MKKIEELLNDPAVVNLSDNCPLWATKIAGNYSLGQLRRLVNRPGKIISENIIAAMKRNFEAPVEAEGFNTVITWYSE